MREITEHKINPCNDKLDIKVVDEAGPGNANHQYAIEGPVPNFVPTTLYFQNGPISEEGVNGITQEVLIAICIDRLRSFQTGHFACRENSIALTKLEEAQHWLHHRTQKRMLRGVEGTHRK